MLTQDRSRCGSQRGGEGGFGPWMFSSCPDKAVLPPASFILLQLRILVQETSTRPQRRPAATEQKGSTQQKGPEVPPPPNTHTGSPGNKWVNSSTSPPFGTTRRLQQLFFFVFCSRLPPLSPNLQRNPLGLKAPPPHRMGVGGAGGDWSRGLDGSSVLSKRIRANSGGDRPSDDQSERL